MKKYRLVRLDEDVYQEIKQAKRVAQAQAQTDYTISEFLRNLINELIKAHIKK